MEFRHELKFVVSDAQLEALRYRIAPFMQTDKNQKDGCYTITSLYFDDVYDSCFRENLGGFDRRSKYRIRIYENDFGVIKLEKKSKLHGMCKKESVRLSLEECQQLTDGENLYSRAGLDAKKQLLLCEMQMRGLMPKSIVEYERTAFVNPVGNVRITFDRNIRGSLKVEDFYDERICMVPLLDEGVHVLEVKYDEFLPAYIYQALEIETLQQTSFSKYGYSRTI